MTGSQESGLWRWHPPSQPTSHPPRRVSWTPEVGPLPAEDAAGRGGEGWRASQGHAPGPPQHLWALWPQDVRGRSPLCPVPTCRPLTCRPGLGEQASRTRPASALETGRPCPAWRLVTSGGFDLDQWGHRGGCSQALLFPGTEDSGWGSALSMASCGVTGGCESGSQLQPPWPWGESEVSSNPSWTHPVC